MSDGLRPTASGHGGELGPAERLRVLDGLHRDGLITDEEYAAGRRQAVAALTAGAIEPTPPAPAEPPPPALPPPSTATAQEPKRERPTWLIPVVVAGGLLLALIIWLLVGLAGGSDEPEPVPLSSAAAPSARQINASAGVVGRALAKVTDEEDLAGLKKTVDQQLTLADSVRQSVASLRVDDAERPAWRAFVRGAGIYRGYLVVLRRSVALDPPKGVADANRARRRAKATKTQFAKVTKAEPALTFAALDGAGLGSTATLVSVLKKAGEEAVPPPRRYVPSPSPAPVPAPAPSKQPF
jgi:hypothetical protein